jgi:hypothetical protein
VGHFKTRVKRFTRVYIGENSQILTVSNKKIILF